MNGDLGNLLTGEMGEAEARFSHEDFAGDYGRRVMGRVRRRRAVRAAGVGGGAMLTAGALAIGATQVPWGALGVAGLSDVGGTDCATPWPSVGVPRYSAIIDTDQGSITNLSIVDAATGTVIVDGVRQADGTYVFTDGYGDSLDAVQGSAGHYTVALPPGVTSLESTSTLAFRSAAVSTNYLSVRPPTLVVDDGGAERQARGECYTPSPMPPGEPSLTANRDAVVSPFQCGFEFPTNLQATSELGVVARVVSADDLRSEFDRRFGNQSPTTDVGEGAAVWASATGMPTSTGDVIATVSVTDPSAGSGSITGWSVSREPGVYQLLPGGLSFVGTRDGVVVATVVPGYDGATPGMVLDRDGVDADPDAFLVDRSALTACTSTAGSLDSLDLYVVAGYDANPGLVYAWNEVPAP